MDKRIATIVLLGSLAIPGTALAEPNNNDRKNAAQECRDERGTTSEEREAFRAHYGNKRNAFGKCVSQRAKDEEAERRRAHSEAVNDCREEHPRGQGKPEKGQANAFGKCVSTKAKQKRAEADQRDQQQIEARHEAAKECDEEREQDRQAFAEKYGTNHNKRNAFGKCVSQHARANS